MTIMAEINLERLLEFSGVDAYLKLDFELDVVESRSKDNEFDQQKLIKIVQQIRNNQNTLNNLEFNVLLTEKGVIVVSKLSCFYLAVLAGARGPVDISKLIAFIETCRQGSQISF